MLPVRISDDLVVTIGEAAVTLTPTEGLGLAEQLARKSFEQIARKSFERTLSEEVESLSLRGAGQR